MTNKEQELLDAAEGWRLLAIEYRRAAQDDRMDGRDLSEPGDSPGDHKANLADRTAKALELEAASGVPVCTCHFWPRGECPKEIRQ